VAVDETAGLSTGFAIACSHGLRRWPVAAALPLARPTRWLAAFLLRLGQFEGGNLRAREIRVLIGSRGQWISGPRDAYDRDQAKQRSAANLPKSQHRTPS